jgi:putative Holliday junction resolvase
MDGTRGESARRCEDFAKMLGEFSGLSVKLFDERQTTVLATTYLNTTDTCGQKRKDIIDAVSAVILLEDYLRFKKII